MLYIVKNVHIIYFEHNDCIFCGVKNTNLLNMDYIHLQFSKIAKSVFFMRRAYNLSTAARKCRTEKNDRQLSGHANAYRVETWNDGPAFDWALDSWHSVTPTRLPSSVHWVASNQSYVRQSPQSDDAVSANAHFVRRVWYSHFWGQWFEAEKL